MRVAQNKPSRRFRSKQERRAIVEESLRPGTSVSLVARAHNVNANQVFAWRKQYREGRLEVPAMANALVPVTIRDVVEQVHHRSVQSKSLPTGIIDIDLGHARVRIEGAADPECVRAAVEGLIR